MKNNLLTLECTECNCVFAIDAGFAAVIEQTANNPDREKPYVYCPHGHAMQAKSDSQLKDEAVEFSDNVVRLGHKR